MNHLFQRSTPESKTYFAGVVEFSPEPFRSNETIEHRVNNVAEAYSLIISSDEAFLTDIIVFPEGTFNHDLFYLKKDTDFSPAFTIPDPSEKLSPCDLLDSHPALKKISCAARSSSKYIVINVAEKVAIGSRDQKQQMIFYNTNVVFDRNGNVIARYRKYNLFNEPGTSVTRQAELSHFETDFGVTFGQFICFDILFKSPAVDLLSKLRISDFVYSAMWFSELPFMTAVQTQNMWAAGGREVNLLAAGASRPEVGSTGSGIYSKNGPLVSIFSGVTTRRILVAEVPKKAYWEDVEINERFFKPITGEEKKERVFREEYKKVRVTKDDLSVYSTKMLVFPVGVTKIQENLCYEGFCCEFEMTVHKEREQTMEDQGYRHQIAVFDGVRSYGHGQTTGGVFTCALISCLSASLSSCGQLRATEGGNDVEFQQLKISGSVLASDNVEPMPNTLDYELGPLGGDDYEYKEAQVK